MGGFEPPATGLGTRCNIQAMLHALGIQFRFGVLPLRLDPTPRGGESMTSGAAPLSSTYLAGPHPSGEPSSRRRICATAISRESRIEVSRKRVRSSRFSRPLPRQLLGRITTTRSEEIGDRIGARPRFGPKRTAPGSARSLGDSPVTSPSPVCDPSPDRRAHPRFRPSPSPL